MVHAHNIHDMGLTSMGTVERRRSTRSTTWRLGSEARASRGSRRSSSVRAGDRGDANDANGLRSLQSGQNSEPDCRA